MTCAGPARSQHSADGSEIDSRTHLEALSIAVVEARLQWYLEAKLHGVAVEELLEAGHG